MDAFFTYFRIAIRALRGHLFRSALTTVSILIGAFSIVLMSSLAASGLATLTSGLESMGGARLIMVWGKEPDRARGKTASYNLGLTDKDRQAIYTTVPHLAEKMMYASVGNLVVSAEGSHWINTDVVGGDGNFFETFGMRFEKGHAFTDEDSRSQAHVCVVGYKLAQRLYDGDAVGKTLVRDRDTRCRVIGQLADQDHFDVNFGFDWSDVVVFPLGTLESVMPDAQRAVSLVLKTDDGAHNEIVKRVVNAILLERHNHVDDFEILDFGTAMEKWNAMVTIMEGIVGFIAGIALLVGGVGVMNMMLVSVSERVREIGIRKALGARPAAIRTQFLCESMLLSGCGGLLGVLLGIGSALALAPLLRSYSSGWVNIVAYGAATKALVVAVSIGLLFGYVPARRAAALDAINAMRR